MSEHLRNQLVDAIRSQNALLVVGTGVPLLATGQAPTASWRGLMEHGKERVADLRRDLAADWVEVVSRDVASERIRDMLVGAQRITDELQSLPGNQYDKWLSDAVGSLKATSPGILSALIELGIPIATTNYDTLIDDYQETAPITWSDLPRIQAALRRQTNEIIHLHGHWRSAKSVVFGYESYATVIGDHAAQALMRAMISVQTLVFVGAADGLTDPNFSGLLEWLHDELASTDFPPFILLPEAELNNHNPDLIAKGLLGLSYGRNYEDLELFIADLAHDASRSVDTSQLLDWPNLLTKLNRLRTRIRRDFRPDLVVSMSGPGGFAPSYCCSLDTDDVPLVTAVTFPRRTDDGDAPVAAFRESARSAGWLEITSTKWHVFLPDILHHLKPNSRVLLFDDRVIGGNVQARVARFLRDRGHEVRRAALVVSSAAAGDVDYFELQLDVPFAFPWGGKYGRARQPHS
jgi:hypothetical protein